LALHDVKLNTLALGQRLEAVTLDGAVVDEAVLAAIIRRDETKALGIVEPLHLAGRTHRYRSVVMLLVQEAECGTAIAPTLTKTVVLSHCQHRPWPPDLPNPGADNIVTPGPAQHRRVYRGVRWVTRLAGRTQAGRCSGRPLSFHASLYRRVS